MQVLREDGRSAVGGWATEAPPGKPDAKSYMWARRSNEPGKPIVLFDYMPSRGDALPFRILDGYKGYLQTDGCAGYDETGARDGVVHVGCLAHARRKVFQAVKARHKARGDGEKGVSPKALLLIRKIYAIDKAAPEAKMSPAQRHAQRQSQARPIWDELRAWLDANLPASPPQSLTGKSSEHAARP